MTACASGGRRLCAGKVGAKGGEQEDGGTGAGNRECLVLASTRGSFLLMEKSFICAGCPRQRCLAGTSSQRLCGKWESLLAVRGSQLLALLAGHSSGLFVHLSV